MDIAVQRVPGKRAGSFVYVMEDNYIFHLYKERALRCRKHKHYACLARLTMSGERFFMKGHHSHANEENEIARIAVENDCKRRAAEQPVRPKVIFEQARQEHPNAIIGFGPNLKRAIQRARRRLQPAIPHSFDEAERTITGFDMYRKTLNQSADFFLGRVSIDTGNAFIFISLALLPEIRTTREIRLDGTFKTVPNLFYELFTLHVLAYGKVLMSNKTAELYRMAIDRILQILQEVNPGDHFEVEVLISDFELAIMGTMQEAFLNARSRGCWFHYAQAIYRRAYKEGLQRAYRSGGVIKSIVKKLISLALLPSNRAYEGFQTIRHRTENALLAKNPQSRAGVARLFQYMGGYWFTNQGPERFCVSGDDHRTNNEVESFNRWFNARCGPHHQNFLVFHTDFIAIRAAQQIRRPQRLVNKRRDRNIKTLTEQLTSSAIEIYEFLDVAEEFFEPDQLDRTADGLARPAPENDDLEGQVGIVAEEPASVHRQPVRRRRLSAENIDEVPAILAFIAVLQSLKFSIIFPGLLLFIHQYDLFSFLI
ncbi:Uncharacterized protein APZ42_024988 [Daphnia magna]|uniref:MULE transposase domain-containing protein n=1 Tax=Daphnia magna TaxID=35525 RepID=A0A164TK64_9CRUS|nr:Uncharacterized protein APZ42_024988 [Daphnia magna]